MTNLPTTIEELDAAYYPCAEEFFYAHRHTWLTYENTLIIPNHSSIAPSDCDPTTILTDSIRLASSGLLASDMDKVTEKEMAIAMAENGWMWVLHSRLKERQVDHLIAVKNHIHWIIKNPTRITLGETIEVEEGRNISLTNIGDILELKRAKWYRFSTFPILDETWTLIGIIESKYVKDRYADDDIMAHMRKIDNVPIISEESLWDEPIKKVDNFFQSNKWEDNLLILDASWGLKWLATESDIHTLKKEQANKSITSTRDNDLRLQAGATIPIFRKDGELDRIKILNHLDELVENGLDMVAVSTAHGDSDVVGELTRMARDAHPNLDIMAGNVVTAWWYEFLVKAGANIVKVWIWPWSICTTRIVAGVWASQLTALSVISQASQILWWATIVADGWVSVESSIAKALSLKNVEAVMLWSKFGWADESPGKRIFIDGEEYVEYRGMGSDEAMAEWSGERYRQDTSNWKGIAEGASWYVKATWPVAGTISHLTKAAQLTYGYTWSRTNAELVENARYHHIPESVIRESNLHNLYMPKA